jgi:hypothetical protein
MQFLYAPDGQDQITPGQSYDTISVTVIDEPLG